MPSLLFLCCYRVRSVEQHTPRLERAGDAVGDRCLDRIDHTAGSGDIGIERLHTSASTESIRCPFGVARESGIDSGMASSRDRLEGVSSAVGPRSYISRKSRQNALAKNPRCHGAEDDELSIVSDPSALYLAPMITVSSSSSGVRTSPATDRGNRSTMKSHGSVSTSVPSATRRQLTSTDGATPEGTPERRRAESTAPSKPDSVLTDDDPSAPFRTWLLTQTLDADITPNRGAAPGATPNRGGTPSSHLQSPRQPLEENATSSISSRTTVSMKAPGFVSVRPPAPIPHAEHQEGKGRYTLDAPGTRRESYACGTDRKAYPSIQADFGLGIRSPNTPGQRSDSNSPGRRDIYRPLSSCK